MVKNPLALQEMGWIVAGSVPGSGRFSGDHSSIHVWETLCTEKPGRLQSMGLQRVGCDLATRLNNN